MQTSKQEKSLLSMTGKQKRKAAKSVEANRKSSQRLTLAVFLTAKVQQFPESATQSDQKKLKKTPKQPNVSDKREQRKLAYSAERRKRRRSQPNNKTTRKTSKPQNLKTSQPHNLKTSKTNESLSPNETGGLAILMLTIKSYSCGPAATSALPASLVVYFAKFLMKRAARSLAFSSH